MAIVLNGTSQYVTTTSADACPVTGQGFLLSAWVKTNTTPGTTNRAVVGWTEDGVADSQIRISMNNSGQLGFGIKPDNAGSAQFTYNSTVCSDGNWHHVVLWYDSVTLTATSIVDNKGTATRTLTSGQTLLLTRFTAGVTIRAVVDTGTYWEGELAEVVFMRGDFTEAHARSFYNIGFPKRGYAAGTIQARWPFETDANAAGGSGPNLTATGSPTYNDNEDTLFAAIDAYTPTAISSSAAALVLEDDLDSATSHYVRVTTASAGWLVVGFVIDYNDGVSYGENYTQSVPFKIDETRSTANSFANMLSSYIENNFRYVYAPLAGDWMVRVTVPGAVGILRGVSVRFDATSGTVPLYGQSFHCWPTAIRAGGVDYSLVRGLDGRATLGINRGGVLVYNGDNIARVSSGDDTFHSGGAFVELSAGVAVISTGHNGASEIAYAAAGAFTNAMTWHTISTGDNSYAVAVADENDVIYMQTRGTDDASNGYHGVVYHIAGLPGGSPTITFDHLGGDGTRQYPNIAYRSGNLIAFGWTGAWSYGFAAIYDITANKWYDFAKNQRGGNDLGTIATPRFDSTVWTTTQAAGTGLRIYGGFDSTYQSCSLFDLRDWGTTGAKGGFLYSTAGGLLNELTPTTLRWVVQIGATRYVSGTDFSAPADWTSNYWRTFSAVRWLDDDPATNVALLFIIDHDDRVAGGNYDTALPQGYTPYYDVGGRRLRVYKITNPISASPTFELLGGSVPSITHSLTAGFVRSVPGKPNTFRWQEATTEIHETKRQAAEFEYTWQEAPSSGVAGRGISLRMGLGL